IYDDADQVSLIKRSMKEVDVDPKRFSPRAVQSAMSSAKSVLLGVEGFGMRKETYFDEIVHRVYERYDHLISQSGAVDFDDLLLKTYFLFEQFPDVAKKYQDRYVHFMIDEFQDTNVVQYAIARQLSQTYRNLCVVGDPDQSIYSWRNADIRNILSFQSDYAEAKIIALEENYRSTQTILDAAQSVIAPNSQRVEKNLWTKNGQGVPIVVKEEYNEQDEARFVIKEIQNLTRNEGYDLGDIAVMYRVNAQSRALEESCLRYGVPYQVVGGQKFYQRQEVKDVAAYLRLVANPHDDVALARVINVPTRGIGQRTLDELTRIARDSSISMFAAIGTVTQAGEQVQPLGNNANNPFAPRSAKALVNFHDLVSRLVDESKNLDLIELIDLTLERTGYKRYLLEDAERGEDRWENIQEFRSSARDYLQLGITEALTAFLESVSLVSDIDTFEEKAEAMTLITLHQAKGLEFPVVFIVGMEEGILPHMRSMDDASEMEEERRLCYVGVTRAKDRLYLLRAFRRGFRGGSEPSVPSRFLADIPKELILAPDQQEAPAPKAKSTMGGWTPGSGKKPSTRANSTAIGNVRRIQRNDDSPKPRRTRDAPAPAKATFATGDKVRHSKFGEGIVMSCTPSGGDFEVTVAFKESNGVKRLLLSFAPLEKIE
ncbi:MAG: UvrD-helicase domain-containing protein, partial [Chloroflexi bacterium]|nr:UvrD-helicase domain-containing protein [Chloroflexota bacterium]